MATKEDIVIWARSLVWSGEYNEEEVALEIADQLGEGDEFDETWIQNAIRSEVESKQKAEETWPKVTDFDRLDRQAGELLARLHGQLSVEDPEFEERANANALRWTANASFLSPILSVSSPSWKYAAANACRDFASVCPASSCSSSA